VPFGRPERLPRRLSFPARPSVGAPPYPRWGYPPVGLPALLHYQTVGYLRRAPPSGVSARAGSAIARTASAPATAHHRVITAHSIASALRRRRGASVVGRDARLASLRDQREGLLIDGPPHLFCSRWSAAFATTSQSQYPPLAFNQARRESAERLAVQLQARCTSPAVR
jgi:hypothetical protein